MAKKSNKVTVKTLKHEEATRKNIPTVEYQSVIAKEVENPTKDEIESLKFQFGISKTIGRGGRRYLPYAFTEQGVAMLSGILNSQRAVQVNIEIMRAFVKLQRNDRLP